MRLKETSKQRTDSTHNYILSAIRTLNRLELVGEMLRAALNAIACQTRSLCTRSDKYPCSLTLYPQSQQEALQKVGQLKTTSQWWQEC